MIAVCSLISLALLAAAGAMIDSHRRDWRDAGGGADPDRRRFVRRQNQRRMTASVLLAVAGVLIGLWPVTPRTPFWVMNYAATLSLAAVALLACGVLDAIASGRFYRRRARALAERQREEVQRLLDAARPGEAGDDAPARD